MKNFTFKRKIIALTILILITLNYSPVFGLQIKKIDEKIFTTSYLDEKYIEINLSFSDPEVVKYGDYWVVRVNETNHNRMNPGKPVLPVSIFIYQLNFGSKILNVEFQNSTPEIINLSGIISFCKANYDNFGLKNSEFYTDYAAYTSSDTYPADWVNFHTGGGLSKGEHTTYLVVRIYPVRYFADENQLQFIKKC